MSKHQSADPHAELAPTLRIAGTPSAEIRDRDRDPNGEELGFRSIHLRERKRVLNPRESLRENYRKERGVVDRDGEEEWGDFGLSTTAQV